MIITTTPSVEGRRIVEYRGIVFGEVISGVNFVKDIAASFSNFFGGRSSSYEEELVMARQNALRELEQRAYAMGANAVVGVDIDYEVLGADNGIAGAPVLWFFWVPGFQLLCLEFPFRHSGGV